MANVKDWVAKIRAAVYGKDVRESIAASIEAMNNECEEAVGGYDEAIENAEQAITQAQSGAAAANSAASTANTAADRANKAAEAVEGLDVSQLVQQINELKAQLTPEFLKVWDCPDGDAKLELWAAASSGMVEYYAILTGTFSKNNYSHDNTSTSGTKDGEMVNLFEADPKFLPVLSETDDDVQSVTLNGIVGIDDGKATAISILLINSAGTAIQTVSADLTGHTLLHLGTVIPLGRVKSQAYQG